MHQENQVNLLNGKETSSPFVCVKLTVLKGGRERQEEYAYRLTASVVSRELHLESLSVKTVFSMELFNSEYSPELIVWLLFCARSVFLPFMRLM